MTDQNQIPTPAQQPSKCPPDCDCTADCERLERDFFSSDPEDNDPGAAFVTHNVDDTITIEVRSPGDRVSSKVEMSLDAWFKLCSIGSLAAQPPAAPVETVAAEPDYEIVKAGDDAYRACAGGAHYAGMDGITCAYRAMAKVLADRATKSAPGANTTQKNAERLSSSDAAGSGADTRLSAETMQVAAPVAWRHRNYATDPWLYSTEKPLRASPKVRGAYIPHDAEIQPLYDAPAPQRSDALQALADIDRDLIGHDETMANLNALKVHR